MRESDRAKSQANLNFQCEKFSNKPMGGKNSNLKEARFLPTKQCIHLVLKSDRALGDWSFLRQSRAVTGLIQRLAHENAIKVRGLAAAGNHIHVLIQIRRRSHYFRFIRSLTGLLARLVTGAQRGAGLIEGFWTQKPFTRAVSWGREYLSLMRYFRLNRLEAKWTIKRTQALRLLSILEKDLIPAASPNPVPI